MTAYFPILYPDEILHSWIARFAIRTLVNPRQVLKRLFGSIHALQNVEKIYGVNKLHEQIGHLYQFTPLELIEKTTLWPYYSFFLGEKISRQLLDHLLNGKSLHAIYITRQNDFRFKYCPDCVKYDTVQFGEPYFHRVHQLPEIFICAVHKTFLEEETSKHEGVPRLLAASREVCPVTTGRKNDNTKLYDITSRMWTILNRSESSDKYDHANYLGNTKESGVSHFSMINAAGEIKSYFGEDLIKLYENAPVGRGYKLLGRNFWINDKRRLRPINYVLASVFHQARQIQESKQEEHIRMKSNCINRFCENYKEVIGSEFVSITRGPSFIAVKVECSCGTAYIDRLEKVTLKKKARSLLTISKEYHELTLRKRTSKINKSTIARQLGINRSGLRKFTVSSKPNPKSKEISNKFNELEKCKSRYLKKVTSQSFVSLTKTRRENMILYRTLYENCRDWLMEVNREKRVRSAFKSKTDYKKLDALCSKNIVKNYHKFIIENTNQRISKSLLMRSCGLERRDYCKLKFLPTFELLLKTYAETQQDYLIRTSRPLPIKRRIRYKIDYPL